MAPLETPDATISQDAGANLPVQPDALSALSKYELSAQNNNAYAPTIIQASGSEHVRDFSIAETFANSVLFCRLGAYCIEPANRDDEINKQ